jgi:hypothetical protein
MNKMTTLGATVAGSAWQSWTVPPSIEAMCKNSSRRPLHQQPSFSLLHSLNSRQQHPSVAAIRCGHFHVTTTMESSSSQPSTSFFQPQQ